jgi:hypothetical protein
MVCFDMLIQIILVI